MTRKKWLAGRAALCKRLPTLLYTGSLLLSHVLPCLKNELCGRGLERVGSHAGWYSKLGDDLRRSFYGKKVNGEYAALPAVRFRCIALIFLYSSA